MFATAVELVATFTRPIHSIQRLYGSTEVHPGAATLYFINNEGWALTCRHVAQMIMAAGELQDRLRAFKAELGALPHKKKNQLLRNLERKYGFDKMKVAEIKHRFMGCVEGDLDLSIQLHPALDVALLKFSDFTTLGCSQFPVFARSGADLRPGRFMCRLGFPFPEFTNFKYDPSDDTICWTQEGRELTPRFPIEGMVTRHLLDSNGSLIGFELSTPGLRGQSGGPVFDAEGRVWGMQVSTAHLDLDFDVDTEVIRAGSKMRVRDSAFLHVGHCIHVDVLKEFMREHRVSFAEA